MDRMAIAFPNIDPVAIHIYGQFAIRWYGLAYMAGLMLGWFYMRRLCEDRRLWGGPSPMQLEQVDDFLFWATLGTVLGGRTGHFLFYAPQQLLENPLQFFQIWGGGMAFHGGLLGVGLAVLLYARNQGIPVRSLMDLSAAAVPFGLFFGRIANFINVEMYGQRSDVPWAVNFPHVAGARHPTQIYEALLEGLAMFVLLRLFTHGRRSFLTPGVTAGVFLIAYGVFRIFAESFKEPDKTDWFVRFNEWLIAHGLSIGMVYSLPMIALGAYLIATARKAPAADGRAPDALPAKA
jgi:phosphatidylglycerol:prolipoprotein diacylglycerol transferase